MNEKVTHLVRTNKKNALGRTISLRFFNEIGDKIGNWTILDFPYRENNNTKIKCRCECGTIKDLNYFNLRNRQMPYSCGCKSIYYGTKKKQAIENEIVGKTNFNSYGTEMKIIQYEGANKVLIEFQDEYKTKKYTDMKSFNQGKVSNPYDKTVLGVGYYGFDFIKKSSSKEWEQCYNVWHHMLRRCYDSKHQQEKCPSYIGCSVCDEWHNFKNFSEWYFENYIDFGEEKSCLDKDILHKGNKIYSPENCCFVPNEINCLFTKTNAKRGKCCIGVTFNKRLQKYIAQCKHGGGCPQIHLGVFETELEAFSAYKVYKENYIKQVAEKYKGKISNEVYQAMYNYKVEITD